MTDDATFRGECSRCLGLCCVALSFDRGPYFAFDKPADEVCHHLGDDHRCAIHDRLATVGMSGCARYDCRGAGQLATALFAGLDWRDSPSVQRQMFRAFGLLREIQLMRLALRCAGLSPQALEPSGGWTLATLLANAATVLATARASLAAHGSARRLAS